jgi:hypothetical protein
VGCGNFAPKDGEALARTRHLTTASEVPILQKTNRRKNGVNKSAKAAPVVHSICDTNLRDCRVD